VTDLLLVAQWAKSHTTDAAVFNAACRLLEATDAR
jgi:hypothetical protein